MATINSWNNTVAATAVSIDSSFQISSTGIVTNANQPAFAAYCASDHFLVTGDNTLYTIPMDTVIFDQTSSFNTGTFTYTVPKTGIYMINMYLSFRNAQDVAGIDFYVYINANSTQYKIFAAGTFSGFSGTITASSGALGADPVSAIGGTVLVSLTAAQTVLFQFVGANSTKLAGVVGGQTATYCSGYLVA